MRPPFRIPYTLNFYQQCSIDAIHRILHLIFADYSIQTNTPPQIMDLMKKPSTTVKAHNSSMLNCIKKIIELN